MLRTGRRTGCVTRPDPRFENQITTYISQEEEELEVEAQGELSANRTIEENVYKAIEKCKSLRPSSIVSE